MSGPRNRKAFAKAQRDRAAIREALLEHSRQHPISAPPTAEELRQTLGLRLSIRRLQQHVRSLRIEAEIRELIHEQLGREQAPTAAVESES